VKGSQELSLVLSTVLSRRKETTKTSTAGGPITLDTAIYKKIAKTLHLRRQSILNNIISLEQTAFFPLKLFFIIIFRLKYCIGLRERHWVPVPVPAPEPARTRTRPHPRVWVGYGCNLSSMGGCGWVRIYIIQWPQGPPAASWPQRS
jgi:hypothetical protein